MSDTSQCLVGVLCLALVVFALDRWAVARARGDQIRQTKRAARTVYKLFTEEDENESTAQD